MAENISPKQPYLSEKILEALEFASLAHKDQRRRGGQQVPYISHPAAVGLILSHAGVGEEVVIAGILHDVIEDTIYNYDDIAVRFGKQVADLVTYVSEDKNLKWPQRKQAYIDHLKDAPIEALAISAADLLANHTSMKMEMETHGMQLLKEWPLPEASLEFNRQRLEVIASRLHHPLVDELRQVADQVERLFKEHNG